MNLGTSLLFYGAIGVAIAAALLVRHDRLGRAERGFRAATALAFWPLYLPLLLEGAAGSVDAPGAPEAPPGELAAAIDQVESELERALGSLDGWSDAALVHERGRFVELRAACRQQAARIAELDHLLGQFGDAEMTGSEEEMASRPQRLVASENARRDNVERLRSLRRRLHEDLLSTLAKVRELVTLIHLARFTGAPAARAEELVAQIADAVVSLSEVASWQEG
jgi:hypothetical protein